MAHDTDQHNDPFKVCTNMKTLYVEIDNQNFLL